MSVLKVIFTIVLYEKCELMCHADDVASVMKGVESISTHISLPQADYLFMRCVSLTLTGLLPVWRLAKVLKMFWQWFWQSTTQDWFLDKNKWKHWNVCGLWKRICWFPCPQVTVKVWYPICVVGCYEPSTASRVAWHLLLYPSTSYKKIKWPVCIAALYQFANWMLRDMLPQFLKKVMIMFSKKWVYFCYRWGWALIPPTPHKITQGPVSLNDILPAIQIRCKLHLAVIPFLAIRSRQIFAYATRA